MPFGLPKSMQYDRDTIKILRKVLKPDSNCLDIGCHKGEILKLMLKYAPKGHHFGFEPIPGLAEPLRKKFSDKATILEVGLSDHTGTSSFNYVISRPEYSGIKKRDYDRPNEKDKEITIQVDCMDNMVPEDLDVNLIKIDVEGGEYGVLKGGTKTIKRNRPIIIFEHGKGAAEHYDTTPEMVFDLIDRDFGMKINTLQEFLKGSDAMGRENLIEQFETSENYYFIAYP